MAYIILYFITIDKSYKCSENSQHPTPSFYRSVSWVSERWSHLARNSYNAKYDELRQTQTKELRSSEEEEITCDVDDKWKLHRDSDIKSMDGKKDLI